MILESLVYILFFIFGLCIGSFLNCVIYRLEEGKNLKGRSFCPNCRHTLAFYDLFPVLSFVFLGGKCRYCKEKISWQYPIVELSTGFVFLIIFWQKSFFLFDIFKIINFAFIFYIVSSLIIIFVYDLKHYLIPDKILFPAIAISFVYVLIFSQTLFYNYIVAALIGFLFFFSIFAISKGKWMGFGDVKLAILMGLVLGFPDILSALFLAFFFGAIIGLILMFLKHKSLKSEIPFGPFLILGTFIALLWGNSLIQWYLSLIMK